MLAGLQHLSGGRLKMNGRPLLLLHTVGARSGKPRTTMLTQFPEADGSTVIVASFGGTAQHPAWYFNLAKHPDQVFIERRGKLLPVRPQSLGGGERERVWNRIVATAPQFAEYQRKTDRELPVVRLTPTP
jgi:deazaflavin-dependent oxidoreductase (nitroreductase family)